MALADLHHPALWRGDSLLHSTQPVRPSGHTALDAVLPGGGWPLGTVTELCLPRPGVGELALLAPALAALSQGGAQLLLIAPPHPPYAPAWAAQGIALERLLWVRTTQTREAQWVCEQALREPACGAVLVWQAGPLPERDARRLKLAAAVGGGCGFVLRSGSPATHSPFPLRLALEGAVGGLTLRVLKRRGPPLASPLFLPLFPAHDDTRHPHAVAGTPSSPSGTRNRPARQRLALA